MPTKPILVSCAALAVFALIAGCSPVSSPSTSQNPNTDARSAKNGGTLRVALSAEPDGSTDVDVAYRYQTGEYVYVQLKRNGQGVDGIGLSVSLDCANPTT